MVACTDVWTLTASLKVKHVYRIHEESYSDVKFRLLTRREKADVEAKYYGKYKLSQTVPIGFGCCHCHEYSWQDASKHAQNYCEGLMSKRDIYKHLHTR